MKQTQPLRHASRQRIVLGGALILMLLVSACAPRGADPVPTAQRQAPAVASTQDAGKTVRQEQGGVVLEHRIDEATSVVARVSAISWKKG